MCHGVLARVALSKGVRARIAHASRPLDAPARHVQRGARGALNRAAGQHVECPSYVQDAPDARTGAGDHPLGGGGASSVMLRVGGRAGQPRPCSGALTRHAVYARHSTGGWLIAQLGGRWVLPARPLGQLSTHVLTGTIGGGRAEFRAPAWPSSGGEDALKRSIDGWSTRLYQQLRHTGR